MFGPLRKLFTRSAAKRVDSTAPPPEPEEELTRSATPEPAVAAAPGDLAILPFGSVLKHVPQDWHGRIGPTAVAGLSFSVSKKQILEQLPRGAVKIAFGELRQVAPAGVFVNTAAHDHELIDLPFGEILGQLQAEVFVRRANQRRFEVPDDIADLFGHKGEPLAQIRVMAKHEIP